MAAIPPGRAASGKETSALVTLAGAIEVERKSNHPGARSNRLIGRSCWPRAAGSALTDLEPMPLSLIVAVGAAGLEIGLQSRRHRQHRGPDAPGSAGTL